MTDETLVREFIEAATTIFEWYDGDREILTHQGYAYPVAVGVNGLTMLRTAMQNAEKSGHVLPPIPIRKTYHQLQLIQEK